MERSGSSAVFFSVGANADLRHDPIVSALANTGKHTNIVELDRNASLCHFRKFSEMSSTNGKFFSLVPDGSPHDVKGEREVVLAAVPSRVEGLHQEEGLARVRAVLLLEPCDDRRRDVHAHVERVRPETELITVPDAELNHS